MATALPDLGRPSPERPSFLPVPQEGHGKSVVILPTMESSRKGSLKFEHDFFPWLLLLLPGVQHLGTIDTACPHLSPCPPGELGLPPVAPAWGLHPSRIGPQLFSPSLRDPRVWELTVSAPQS